MDGENPEGVLLGSSSLVNADEYEVGGELYNRATTFLAVVKWDALISLASKLRHGIACHVGERYSIGHFNMVRQIVFADDVTWVARLRLPELKPVFGVREALDAERCMKIEVSTMNYLRAKTSTPVPEVFHHDVNPTNEVGAPYILMSYIHGNVASEFRIAKECEIGLFGTLEQDRKFRQQMARIQVQLSLLTFDRIGSIFQDGDNFAIGPEVETGRGPWTSPMDFYTDLAPHAILVCETEAPIEVRQSSSFELPRLFERLMSMLGNRDNPGPFGLANRDFGAHNLLVNGDFEIVGMIDFDGVMAAPIEVVAQFPQLAGLDREASGHVETRPAAIERIRKLAPQLTTYRDMVASALAELDSSGTTRANIAEIMISDAASVVQGLKCYGSHQQNVNECWMEAYKMLLQKSNKPSGSTLK